MLEKLIVFIEEYSMEITLRHLLPKILGTIEYQMVTFQCKEDLLKNAPQRLRAYASWLPDTWRILILIDRDDDDCYALKNRLENMVQQAGLLSKKATRGAPFQVVTRLAIEELEAWFFGDWQAVTVAYSRVSKNLMQKAGFRNPDAIKGGTWEALERELKRAGYFTNGLEKAKLADTVAARMDIARNQSSSFRAFIDAVQASMV